MRGRRGARWLAPGVGALLALAAPCGPALGQAMHGSTFLYLAADEFEGLPGLSGRPVRLEADAWYGGDRDRFWMKLDADGDTDGRRGDFKAQALLSRLVTPYWDVQVGLRVDGQRGPADRIRTHVAVGLQGLAPYWFEVEGAAFVGFDGHVSGILQAGYDLLLSQRLILEPEIEVGASVQDLPEWGLESGITEAELALRLRYEIRRELAPYLGFAWRRAFGGTARLLRDSGEAWREGSLVAGVRAWY